MTLNDLPAFAVEEITQGSDELRLRGRFSHLIGVRLGRSYLYCGDAEWPGRGVHHRARRGQHEALGRELP